MMKKNLVVLGIFFALVVFGAYMSWKWIVCRRYVPIGQSLIVTQKTGNPSPGENAYAEAGQQGVQRAILGPGRHFINPWTKSVRPAKDTRIPPGKIGVVKNNVGKSLPKDRFLANEDEKGTQKTVLTPGTWRLNSHGKSVDIEDARTIKPGYTGVQTLRDGPKKGIMDEVLQPGYYNINPREIRVDIVEIGYKVLDLKTEFTRRGRMIYPAANTGVSFPLADGKEMYLDFTVVWGVFPKEAPRIIKDYGDITMVETKIIIPQVLSICKNIGSNLTTMQFIEGDTRESFQEEVTKALQKMGDEKGIHILIALVRGFHPAIDIKETIQARMIAEEEKKTLLIEQETDIVAANLQQARKVVDIAMRDFNAETEALVAEEREKGLKKAAEIRARADQEVAALAKQTAGKEADILKISGQALADVTEAKKKADAMELKLQIDAFGGSRAFNLYTFAQSLPPELRIQYRYAGQGTLWTNGKTDLNDAAIKKMLERIQREEALKKRTRTR